jgi:transposase
MPPIPSKRVRLPSNYQLPRQDPPRKSQTCAACGGSGKRSNGKTCFPCSGSGYVIHAK